MSPDEDKAVTEIETEYATLAARGAFNVYGTFGMRVPFLIALVRRQQARIDELEKGAASSVVAAKDIEIAARESQLAAQATKIAQLEALKLPPPDVTFRKNEPRPDRPMRVDADFPLKNVASAQDAQHDDVAIVSST